MNDMLRVAVVAGTNVDTMMGVEYIRSRGKALDGAKEIKAVYCPVTETCDDQVRFQYYSDAEKKARIDEIFDPEIATGTSDFFIYCNSLSGAFDFDSYAAEKGINVYTPLQVYRTLGGRFSRVGVMAANNISTHGIEKAFMEANDAIYVIGTGNMAMVSAIEAGMEPADIVRECGIGHLVRHMETCGCEAIILGCTHFPYIKDEITKLTGLEVIDPADMMFDALLRRQTDAQ